MNTTTARALSALTAIAALGAGTLAVSARAQAQPQPPGPPPMAGPLPGAVAPASDTDFVRMLMRSNTMELRQAKYMVNRTKDPAVRAFAQRMIDDHSTAAVKLSAATRGTNLIPSPVGGGMAGMGGPGMAGGPAMGGPRMNDRGMAGDGMAMLADYSGTQLDHRYMQLQVPEHKQALGLLEWEQHNGKVAGLKTLATNLLPVVNQHYQLAETYLAQHGLRPTAPNLVDPIPGHPNPTNGGGSSLNPAAQPMNEVTAAPGGATTGTNGQNSNSQPSVTATHQPLGSGTPEPKPSSPANPSGGMAPGPSPTP